MLAPEEKRLTFYDLIQEIISKNYIKTENDLSVTLYIF